MSQRKQLLLCCVFALVLSTLSTEVGYNCRQVETSECGTGYKLSVVAGKVNVDTCVDKTTCDVMQEFKIKMDRCETDDFGDSCTSKICMQVLEYGGCATYDCSSLTSDTPFVNDCEKSCSECSGSASACVYSKVGAGDRVFERCALNCDHLSFLSGTYTQCQSFVGCSCCQKDAKNEKKMCLESNNPFYSYNIYLDEMNVKGYFVVLMAMALAMLF